MKKFLGGFVLCLSLCVLFFCHQKLAFAEASEVVQSEKRLKKDINGSRELKLNSSKKDNTSILKPSYSISLDQKNDQKSDAKKNDLFPQFKPNTSPVRRRDDDSSYNPSNYPGAYPGEIHRGGQQFMNLDTSRQVIQQMQGSQHTLPTLTPPFQAH